MHDLQLVGLTTDRRGLIFRPRAGARSDVSFVVPITAELVGLVAELAEGLEVAEPEALEDAPLDPAEEVAAAEAAAKPRSQLSVRDIQARLRAGEPVSRVASEAGVDEDWIERFAPPIRAEQRRIVDRALEHHLQRSRSAPSAVPLRRAVGMSLADKGIAYTVAAFDAAWSAHLLGHDRWVVEFTYRHRGRDRTATWTYDADADTLTTADRTAAQLGYVAPGRADDEDGEAIDGIIGDPEATNQIGTAAPAPRSRATAARRAPSTTTRPARSSSARKAAPPAKKAAAKRSAAEKRATSKKAAAKKAAAARKTAAAKKAAAKKAAAKKAAAKKSAAVKVAAKKSAAAKKAAARKVPAAQKASAKKVAARRAAARKKAPAVEEATAKQVAGRKAPAPKPVAEEASPERAGAAAVRPTPETPAPRVRPTAVTPPSPAPEARQGEVVARTPRSQHARLPDEAPRPAGRPDLPDRAVAGRPGEVPVADIPLAARPPATNGRPADGAPRPDGDPASARRARAAERSTPTVHFRSGSASPVRAARDQRASDTSRRVDPEAQPDRPGSGSSNGSARPATRRRRQLRGR